MTDESDTSSIEEFIELRKKWMPVSLPKDFDPNKAPTSGEEYLHHVMYEAKKYKTVVSVPINTEKFPQQNTIDLGVFKEDAQKGCKSLLPTVVWKKKKVAEFTVFRDYIQAKLPQLSEVKDQETLRWIDKMETEYPKFSVVSKFNAWTQLQLLDLLAKKLQKVAPGDTISDPMGTWMLALLNVITMPLSPELHNALRTLARLCIKIRGHLPEDTAPEAYTHLNFFICIIGECFNQLDLIACSDD